MAAIEASLFTWRDVEARSDLERFYLVRDHLPDEQLVQYLEVMRGQGRDDYPVRAMWNAVLAGVVFQHLSMESLIRELGRNAALLQDCGFSPLPLQKKPLSRLLRDELTGCMRVEHEVAKEAVSVIPGSANFSRFLANVIELEETLGLVTGMIATLRRQLMEELPDFGRHLGYDGKAIESHSTGRTNRTSGETSDPDADWGKHETGGIDARSGKSWTKIKSWFGYGVHLIADTQYEIPVAVHVTPASASEQIELRDMIAETFAQEPELAERCGDLRRPRSGQRPDQGPAVGRLRHPSPHRHPRAVARGKAAPRLRSVQAHHPPAVPGTRRHHRLYRERQRALHLPANRRAARSCLPRLRVRSQHHQVPLPRRRLRVGMQRPRAVPPSWRRQSGGLRAYCAHRPRRS